MHWFRYALMPRLRHREWWKLLLIDILVAILLAAIVTAPAYLLHLRARVAIATVLLLYLIIVLFLARKSTRIAILAAVLACLAFDFFLLDPIYSLWLKDVQDAIDLCMFLVGAILASWIFAQHRKLVKQTKQLNDLESIRFEERLQEQKTEVNRRDDEFRAVYDVIRYVTREQKDLKEQLRQMAQTIAGTFYFCGIRGCAFYLLDPDGAASMWTVSSARNNMPELSPGDEASVAWVMKHGQAVTLPDLPLVSHTKSSYLRRVVINNADGELCEHNCNYLIPLFSGSGEQTLAVMRLYVQETPHVELMAIKSILRGETDSTGIHAELFSHLCDQAVFIIEQSLIERALNLRQELQKRAEELHTAIISSVSHDFNTPLTLIRGAASGLLNQARPWEDEAAYRVALQDIVSETEWLERIVDRMLALSRIDHNALTPEWELYPIEEVVLLALDEGHLRSLKQGRCIERTIPDGVPAVELDPVLIAQVLANLIENAIRHTPPESPIEVSAQAGKNEVRVSVADRGPGIPRSEMERIFEPFYRIPRQAGGGGSEQGSGLGLAVCRGYVKAHGGRIWVDNRENGGAIFQFTLPINT